MAAIERIKKRRRAFGLSACVVAAALAPAIGGAHDGVASEISLPGTETKLTIPLPGGNTGPHKLCVRSGSTKRCAAAKVVRNGKLTTRVAYAEAGVTLPQVFVNDPQFDDPECDGNEVGVAFHGLVPGGTLTATVNGLKIDVDEQEVPTTVTYDVPSNVGLVSFCAGEPT